MDLRGVLLEVLVEVSETHLEVPWPKDMTDDVSLSNELGFDSVAYVAVISTLEDKLGFIPKTILEDASFPTTFGELVAVSGGELNDNGSGIPGELNEGQAVTVAVQRS